jgi:PAS domain S-box-containing protein
LETLVSKPYYPFLQGGGEMGELTRKYNWSQTSVGNPDNWPQSLRTTVSIILSTRFPMFLWWGDDMIQFYNDAYRPSLGNEGKHPKALGQNAVDCWPEIWDIIYPLILHVKTTGEATWSEDQLIPIYRNKQLENVYWTFGYSPVRADDGKIEGVLVVCQETTEKVENINKLIQSDKHFRNLIKEATVGIIVLTGEEMKVEVVNDLYGKLIGRTTEELLGNNLFDIIPETEEHFRPILEKVRTTGKHEYLYDYPYFVWIDGEKKEGFLNLIYQPYMDVMSDKIGIMALCHDVTDQVYARKRAEASEQKLRSFVESAPFPIGVYIGKEMRIEFANQSIKNVWGKGNDVEGKLYAEVLPELHNQNIFSQLDSVYTTGIPFHAKHQRVDLTVNGQTQIYYFNYSFTPLHDAEGNVYGVMNTAADVTDLNIAKQKIEESEQNLRNIILQAPVAMCIFNGRDLVIEIANNSMFEFWGKSAEEVMNKPVFEAIPEARNQGFEEILNTIFKEGTQFSANEIPVNLLKNGAVKQLFVNLTYLPIRIVGGEVNSIMAMVIDVTDQVHYRHEIEEVVAIRTKELADANEALTRSNQELARSNANLEEFAYAASHDLKEPVRKMHFFGDRLKTTLLNKLTEDEKKTFDRMELASKRMNALIDDLLSYSQLSLKISAFDKVDLNHVIELVLNDLDIEIEEKKAKIIIEKLCTVNGHLRQLQQAFQNLISNALKYNNPDTIPEIVIKSKVLNSKEAGEKLSIKDSGKSFCMIEVKDNGIGFSQEDAERIFNVFTRLHGNAEYRGTGIGLSIVRKVIENHEGYIFAESEPGKGATFQIYLPVL